MTNRMAWFSAALFGSITFSDSSFTQTILAIQAKGEQQAFLEKGFAVLPFQLTLTSPAGPVANAEIKLSITGVENRSRAMARGYEKTLEGPSFHQPVMGSQKGLYETTVRTNVRGEAEVLLTDIVGERKVDLKAVSTGAPTASQLTVEIGPGALSRFASAPLGKKSWLETFELCNGRAYADQPANWKIGIGVVGGSFMPSLQNIQAVSLPGKYNREASARGAALAAGWSDDARYRNSNAVRPNRASHVSLTDGNFHGPGGNDVNSTEYAVCLKKR